MVERRKHSFRCNYIRSMTISRAKSNALPAPLVPSCLSPSRKVCSLASSSSSLSLGPVGGGGGEKRALTRNNYRAISKCNWIRMNYQCTSKSCQSDTSANSRNWLEVKLCKSARSASSYRSRLLTFGKYVNQFRYSEHLGQILPLLHDNEIRREENNMK